MRNRCYAMSLALVASFWLADAVFADQRFYVWTYGYKTLERGSGEVEDYYTLSTPDMGHVKGTMTAEHQIELEVGMTERYDFGIYQVFSQKPGQSLEYEGFKLRSRYKLGTKGKSVLDPLIYLEYIGVSDFSSHAVEFKLILARDMGSFNIALNPIFDLEKKREWELVPEYAIGSSYEISRMLRVGLEAKGSEHGHYLGPVISHGREGLWVALGSAFKMGKIEGGKPEFQIRMLLGVGL